MMMMMDSSISNPCNPMQPHATPCNPMQPHATPCNPHSTPMQPPFNPHSTPMQPPCNPMQPHATPCREYFLILCVLSVKHISLYLDDECKKVPVRVSFTEQKSL